MIEEFQADYSDGWDTFPALSLEYRLEADGTFSARVYDIQTDEWKLYRGMDRARLAGLYALLGVKVLATICRKLEEGKV